MFHLLYNITIEAITYTGSFDMCITPNQYLVGKEKVARTIATVVG